jgi:hypothetical protein
MEEEEKDVPV